MLRRCLQSDNPCFGMIMPPSPSGPYTGGHAPILADADYGTMLEIRSVQMLPDGRSMVETWGSHRYVVLTLDVLVSQRSSVIDLEFWDEAFLMDIQSAEWKGSTIWRSWTCPRLLIHHRRHRP